MTAEAPPTRADAASAYQLRLEELASEIRVAIKAIASNSLSDLQDSVARQEDLCAGLAALSKSLSEGIHSSGQPFHSSADVQVEQKLRATGRAVHDLNLEYASLLKHSGRSIALLSSLCRSHAGHFPEVRGTSLKYQTWSCEV